MKILWISLSVVALALIAFGIYEHVQNNSEETEESGSASGGGSGSGSTDDTNKVGGQRGGSNEYTPRVGGIRGGTNGGFNAPRPKPRIVSIAPYVAVKAPTQLKRA